MYENDNYIGMVIKIEIKLAITFQLFVTQKTSKVILYQCRWGRNKSQNATKIHRL